MCDVHVRGDSPAVLAAALELVEVGLKVRVTLGEVRRWPSGAVRDQSGALRALLTKIAAPLSERGPSEDGAAPRSLSPRRVLMRGKRGAWVPVPEPSVFGVPAVPASEDTLAFLTGGAAVHAYLDRVRPPLTIGKTNEFGRLVRARMGAKLLQALVEPLVRERFGVDADEVEVAIAAPGLNEALTRTGSLSGAVLAIEERTAQRETLVCPAGGWETARAVLLERLALYGAEFSGEENDAPVSADAQIVEVEAAPSRVRAHAKVRTEGPGLPTTDADALQTVALANGEQWSVRVSWEDGPDAWAAHLAGPRLAACADAPARALEALELAGLNATDEPQVELRAAPYIARAEHDFGLERLELQREQDPDEILVGSALHGDEASAAVEDAVGAAIVLRRRLTGIAE